MLALVGLAACGRCEPPPPPGDLLELVPESAQLVLELDLAGLRSAPVLRPAEGGPRAADAAIAARLGLDPRRDLDRVVLAAASPEAPARSGAGAELLLLLRGRVQRERVAAALGRRGELVRERVRGIEALTPRQGEALSLLFLDGGRAPVATLAVVSAGWRERLLDRLEGRGRSALAGRTLGAELRAARRGPATIRLASRLSPALARVLAGLARWPELASVALLSGSARAHDRLELRLEAELVEGEGAAALARRLGSLSTPAPLQLRAEGRRVAARLELDRETLLGWIRRLSE